MMGFSINKGIVKAVGAAAVYLGLGLITTTSLAQSESPAYTTSFTITNENLASLYPWANEASVPSFYWTSEGFPQTLEESIQLFTLETLKLDGIENATVDVTVSGNSAMITLGGDSEYIGEYESVIKKIMDGPNAVANLGLEGVETCKKTYVKEDGKDVICWNPYPDADPYNADPWAFYLPLGMPMINQKAVMLLNYPPSDALCSTSYNDNFTIHRWSEVLGRVGVEDPALYETIVDTHPIAAPGSNEDTEMTAATQFFFTLGKPNYAIGMLDALLYTQPDSNDERTIPLQVAGKDANIIWAKYIGKDTYVGETGYLEREGLPAIPWVSTNHPDVTTYQTCPGDPKGAGSGGYGPSDNLVEDELKDLNAACFLEKLANNPTMTTEDAVYECSKVWCTDEDSEDCNRKAVCIQARLDYDYTSEGNCECEAAAEAFCSYHYDNACPSSTEVTSCYDFNKQCSGGEPSYQSCPATKPNGSSAG